MKAKIYVEDECLTNIPVDGDKPPAGEPWQFYLFTHHAEPDGPFELITISGATERERNDNLRKFIHQRHVKTTPTIPANDTEVCVVATRRRKR